MVWIHCFMFYQCKLYYWFEYIASCSTNVSCIIGLNTLLHVLPMKTLLLVHAKDCWFILIASFPTNGYWFILIASFHTNGYWFILIASFHTNDCWFILIASFTANGSCIIDLYSLLHFLPRKALLVIYIHCFIFYQGLLVNMCCFIIYQGKLY